MNSVFRISFLLICCMSVMTGYAVNAQDLIKEIPVQQAVLFTTDESGNVFVAAKDRTITKWSKDGDSLANYRIIKNGSIQSMDASSSLELYVLQAHFNRLTILDRQLTLKWDLDLSQLQLYNVSSVAQSKDGNFWLFDNINNVLLKVDKQLNPVIKSNDFRLEHGISLKPTHLEERGDRVVLSDAENGIFIFDRYGSLTQDLSITGLNKFQLLEDWLIYFDQGRLEVYDFNEKKIFSLNLPEIEDKIIDARVERERLYLLTKDKLYIFRVEKE